jgi:hypothetical protein
LETTVVEQQDTGQSTEGEFTNRKTRRSFKGLGDNLSKLYRDHPETAYGPLDIHRDFFPEIPIVTIRGHLTKLMKHRVIKKVSGPQLRYILAPLTHRAKTTKPIAENRLNGDSAHALKRVGPIINQSEDSNRRQARILSLQIQNFNGITQTQLFSAMSISWLDELAGNS